MAALRIRSRKQGTFLNSGSLTLIILETSKHLKFTQSLISWKWPIKTNDPLKRHYYESNSWELFWLRMSPAPRTHESSPCLRTDSQLAIFSIWFALGACWGCDVTVRCCLLENPWSWSCYQTNSRTSCFGFTITCNNLESSFLKSKQNLLWQNGQLMPRVAFPGIFWSKPSRIKDSFSSQWQKKPCIQSDELTCQRKCSNNRSVSFTSCLEIQVCRFLRAACGSVGFHHQPWRIATSGAVGFHHQPPRVGALVDALVRRIDPFCLPKQMHEHIELQTPDLSRL